MKELKTADSREKVLSLLQEAYASRINNLAKSISLAQTALAQSRKMAESALIGKSLSHLSLFHMIKGAYESSTNMAEEAMLIFKELGDEKGVADVKYNLAGIYYKTDNFHLGLIYLIDCLDIYKRFEDYHNQARVYKSLGTIYEYFGDQKNAIIAYESSIEAAKKAEDPNLESNAYNPLSGIYLKQKKTKEALDIIERSIAIKKGAGDTRGLAFALYGRAKVYTRIKKYKKAEEDLKKSLEIHEDVGERLGAGMAYRKMGELYLKSGNLKKAKTSLKKALDVCKRYNIAIIRFKSNYHLYQIYKKEGDHVKALYYLQKYLQQKEAVINTQTLQIIENYELITKMETLEKEAQMQKEKAEIIEKKNRAEQASKVKQEFLSTMSHEIRTPLNAVITISSLLRDKSEGEEQELLTSLRLAANNLLQLINDILDFTKLDSGKGVLESRPSNLSALLENTVKTYERMATEKGLQLFLTIGNDVGKFYELDDTKLTQILSNLLSNAIKYTEHGHVSIEVENVGSEDELEILRFKIVDTGIGISENHYDLIFESFSQPQSITTRRQGGSGLGLAIVKKIAELYGSRVYVESTVAKGSLFYFDLKLRRSEAPYQPTAQALDQLKAKTVLLAEDNMINAMVTIKLLSNWGLKTEHAKNGREVVEKSKLRSFDFILMDIHMPEMNGFDATMEIRQKNNPNIASPIFALTADITAEHQKEYASYFTGFLRKPIETEKLYEALLNV